MTLLSLVSSLVAYVVADLLGENSIRQLMHRETAKEVEADQTPIAVIWRMFLSKVTESTSESTSIRTQGHVDSVHIGSMMDGPGHGTWATKGSLIVSVMRDGKERR